MGWGRRSWVYFRNSRRGKPGPFLDSLLNSSIKLILTRHEQAAGFMAAISRLTGRSGVCMSTLGLCNQLGHRRSYAQLAAMLLVMITGQKPVTHSKQGNSDLDVERMPYHQIHHWSSVGATFRPEYVKPSVSPRYERPGAAHLELPEDIAAEDTIGPILQAGHEE